MLNIKVKFTTGLFRLFDNVDPKLTSVTEHILTIGINQKVDENGKWISGTAVRMPLVNIMYFESVDTGEGETVEGEGKTKD